MLNNLDKNNEWASYAGPGGWNDPDMVTFPIIFIFFKRDCPRYLPRQKYREVPTTLRVYLIGFLLVFHWDFLLT